MILRKHAAAGTLLLVISVVAALQILPARSVRAERTKPRQPQSSRTASPVPLDDSLVSPAPKDLALRPDHQHKADALGHFAEAMDREEDGETEKALEAYREVLNVDPGQVELAVRVAGLLIHNDDYPAAIDVLKDAVKAQPAAAQPYLELALIYAKYLKKIDEAVDFANKAIAIDPQNIDAYQRLFEVQLASGNENKALEVLERASKVPSLDAMFWAKLGRLYSSVFLKPDATPTPEQIGRLNDTFRKAQANGGDDPTILREVADYFASTQQINEAVPLYLRVLELQPDEPSVREKLATAFVLTNQRGRAIEVLESIIREHPEKYQSYELLGQLHDDEARSLLRANQKASADTEFKKAAQNYEQSLLINPDHPTTYLRVAELLLGQLKQGERAVSLLKEARRRYPDAPEFAYYLAIALRESKHPQEAIIAFEEALNEAQDSNSDLLKPRFYLDYGAAAEQAGLYEKAAELFRQAIAMDPANAAEAYNSLGYMWAEQNSHLDEAEDAVKRALNLAPDNGAFLDSMAWVQYREGKYEQALETLERAIRNLPEQDPVVFGHLGDVYSKLGRMRQALEAWQKAQTLDPTNTEIASKVDSHKTRVSKTEPTKPLP